jgi:hypothetical protein
LLIVSPDSQASACPLSGRNSTYRAVRNCGATSPALGSTASAAGCPALFGSFVATMAECDFS